MVLASGRAKSSPRVKLRVSLPTVTVIVGSSARAKPDNSKKQNRTRARMMMDARQASIPAQLMSALGQKRTSELGLVTFGAAMAPAAGRDDLKIICASGTPGGKTCHARVLQSPRAKMLQICLTGRS